MSSLDRLAVPRRQKVFKKKLVPLGDTLPYWAKMSLDSKLPVAPSPRGSYTLFTTEVGQPKYISKQKYDFDLTDPLGNAMPAEYDSLQDPYLRNFFHKPQTKRHLENHGLITRDGKIVCSVKEFNEYREYLRYRSVTDFNLKRRSHLERRKAERSNAVSEYNVSDRENSMMKAKFDPSMRSESLVSRLKRRESLLSMRLEEKRLQSLADAERRMKESWEDRKKRQETMLKRENQIEQQEFEKRRQKLEERERTLLRQRDRQLAKLETIKQAYLKERERKLGKSYLERSYDRSNQSQRGTESLDNTSTNRNESIRHITSTPVNDKSENDKETRTEKQSDEDDLHDE